jgi:hypothetical protein
VGEWLTPTRRSIDEQDSARKAAMTKQSHFHQNFLWITAAASREADAVLNLVRKKRIERADSTRESP